jgi:anti-sigma factor RsiW
MTSKFDGCKHNQTAKTENSETADLTIDCFELLSAYIDGELSPSEKHQVQTWLDQDPKIKYRYTQLLILQGQIQHSVAPPSQKSVTEITEGVFHSIERRHRRFQLIWGSSAIAASVLAITSGIIPGISPFGGLKMAEVETPTNSSAIMLAVAVNKPAIDIPIKAVNDYRVENLKTIEN